MPLYKDKAAKFANAFEHLMQDSDDDDDDELETSQTERPSASKAELQPEDEDSIEVLKPEEDSSKVIKPQEELSVIEPSPEPEVTSEIQVHQIDETLSQRKESPPKRQRTTRELHRTSPVISGHICPSHQISSPVTRSGARRRPLRKCVADKQKQKPPVEFISLSSDDDDNDDDVCEIRHVKPTSNPHKSTRATADSSIGLDSSLDSTTELCGNKLLDASFEDYEFKLKIFQYGTYVQYKTTWKTKLKDALKVLIDDLAKSGRHLLLTRSEETQPLSLDETPQSLNFHSGTILDAIAVSECSTSDTKTNVPQKSTHDPNILTLKLQDGQRKHLKEFQIGKSEPLRILKEKYAKEFNHDLDRMKLCFDGDPVGDQDTPEELDIDDDCMLDVLIMANY